jgi:uncharacterized repeat protein (TIGR04138 family)
MTMHHPKLDDVVRKDARYAYEAYEFLFAALAHTQHRLGRVPGAPAGPEGDYHVTGPELVEGVLDLARREFGLMARTVFRVWGVNKTVDFGELVFNLVGANLMSKRPEDCLGDFQDLCDLDKALVEDYRIEVTEGTGEA